MSNFTKSVLYSATVLVAGLVAISAIYNNVTSNDGSDFAQMSPAAGNIPESDIGIDFSNMIDSTKKNALDAAKATGEAFEDASEMAAQKVDEASSALDSIATAAGGAISDAVDATTETVNTATETTETTETAENITAEATETVEETVAEETTTAIDDAAKSIEPAAAEKSTIENIIETPVAE